MSCKICGRYSCTESFHSIAEQVAHDARQAMSDDVDTLRREIQNLQDELESAQARINELEQDLEEAEKEHA